MIHTEYHVINLKGFPSWLAHLELVIFSLIEEAKFISICLDSSILILCCFFGFIKVLVNPFPSASKGVSRTVIVIHLLKKYIAGIS
jgi:hypothetical protein